MKQTEGGALTARELREYKEWLADLAAEAAETGDYGACDREVWEQFDPDGPVGAQIFGSLSERELMAPVLATMDRPGHTPQFDKVYVIYRRYLNRRYGTMNDAKFRARILYKRKQEAELCAPGWQERIAPEALLADCRERGAEVSEEDRARLAAFCAAAARRKSPFVDDQFPKEYRTFLNALAGNWRRALRIMGIPVAARRQASGVQRSLDRGGRK